MAVSEGRLFALRLKRGREARQGAIDSIRDVAGGVTARIGGRTRGTVRRFRTRRDAEEAIRAHYNAALMEYVEARHRRRPPPDGAEEGLDG